MTDDTEKPTCPTSAVPKVRQVRQLTAGEQKSQNEVSHARDIGLPDFRGAWQATKHSNRPRWATLWFPAALAALGFRAGPAAALGFRAGPALGRPRGW
jgi:hypothetical protein